MTSEDVKQAKPITVVQCWDDGVSTDIRLIDILRRHGARASFNLNAGLHDKHRKPEWVFKGTQVEKLGWDEMLETYEGFTIANHSLNHPYLDRISKDQIDVEIRDGRARLQDFFNQEVLGFAYPYNSKNEQVQEAVRAAGHLYARTGDRADGAFPPKNIMAVEPSCHFLADHFWERYEKAKSCSVFYFYGHSYEMITETMWTDFEKMIERISQDPNTVWGNLPDLFSDERTLSPE